LGYAFLEGDRMITLEWIGKDNADWGNARIGPAEFAAFLRQNVEEAL
jgi:hypothetical protein